MSDTFDIYWRSCHKVSIALSSPSRLQRITHSCTVVIIQPKGMGGHVHRSLFTLQLWQCASFPDEEVHTEVQASTIVWRLRCFLSRWKLRSDAALKNSPDNEVMDGDTDCASGLETQPIVASSINTNAVGRFADLVPGVATNGHPKEVAPLIITMPYITWDASAVVFTIGNVRS